MYPNLYYAFKDLFGIEIGFLRIVNSFGFFVAISFLIAAALLSRELKRKSRQGLLQPTEEEMEVGKPASVGEIALNFIGGFILGFKLGGFITIGKEAINDPQTYLFSMAGSWPVGLVGAIGMAAWKWQEKKKQSLESPVKRTVRIWPQDRVGEFTILALIFGLLGAKLFDAFENWSDFVKRPAAYLFSQAGLTFYGGLICAAIAIVIYARKHKISVLHLSDSIAPALMIAYAVGRIGCQVAGDGDWGIYNTAYSVGADGKITEAAPGDFGRDLETHRAYYNWRWKDEPSAMHQHKSVKKPFGFLPNWTVAYNYPHNVNEDGVPLAGCTDNKYCNGLSQPVFPTPLYELIVGTGLFFLLWSLRKRFKTPGTLFCLYLIVNGAERFLVETIRVNTRIDWLPGRPTQAELIAIGLMLTGTIGWIWLARKNRAKTALV